MRKIAVTKIWQIKGNIAKTLEYAANPEKVNFKELKAPPSPEFKRVYQIIQRLHDRFRYEDGFTKTNADLTEAENLLLDLYHEGR